MFQKCVGNSEAITEILDLFRFIVDKYSSMTIPMPQADGSELQGQTVNDYLISLLQQVWDHFYGHVSSQGQGSDDTDAYSEESIALHTVVRILT